MAIFFEFATIFGALDDSEFCTFLIHFFRESWAIIIDIRFMTEYAERQLSRSYVAL